MIVHSHPRLFMQLPLSHNDRIALILRDIRPVFAQKGFEAASMQDLARAASMSAGNFYRYFSSKEAIVEAMIALDLSEMTRDFQMILSAPKPMLLLRQFLAQRVQMHRDNCDGALWAEMNATAQRRPGVATAIARMEETLIGYLVEIFCRETGCPADMAPPDYAQTAALVVLLAKSMIMVSASEHTRSDQLNARVMLIIDTALDDLRAPLQSTAPPLVALNSRS